MKLEKRKKSETTEQILLFSWAKQQEAFFPELKNIFHVPNEGKRTNGNILKAAGVKEGVPDIFLLVPKKGFCGLALEMKFGKNKTTPAQQDWLKRLQRAGYKIAVPYGFLEAQAEIREYLQNPGEPPMQYCEEAPKQENKCLGSHSPDCYSHFCQNCRKKGE